jgi:twitching motility protein PilT
VPGSGRPGAARGRPLILAQRPPGPGPRPGLSPVPPDGSLRSPTPGRRDPTEARRDAASAALKGGPPAADPLRVSEPAEPTGGAGPAADVPHPRRALRTLADQPDAPSVLPYLRALVELLGSDLHCKVGSPPRVRIDGRLRRLQAPVLTAQDTERMVDEVLRDDLAEEFATTHEADFAYAVAGLGRFRVNAFRARGAAGLVFRRVSMGAIPLEDLGLPEVVASLALEPRGLVLVTGPTGSGKSTTLAGMVDLINLQREVHIVTIEDPIEVLHEDKLGMINQREVRVDTGDFAAALRSAMRQDPDVILVGEMRDQETVKAALQAAETGHLVLSTLHTTDAQETISRIIDFFPPHEQKQIRLSLAQALRGIVCQRLIARADELGRCVAVEILVNTGRIADAIADQEKTLGVEDLVAEGAFYGMQTFDQHLVTLVRDGLVSIDDAMLTSTNPHDLTVELRRLGLMS